MKKTLLIASLLALAACGNLPQVQLPTQTPAQAAAKICPSLTATITGLQALVGLDPAVVKALDDASKVVTPVCAMDFTTVAATDLKSMVTNVAPKLVAAVKLTTLSDEKKNEAILAVSATQIVIANLP